MEPFIGMITMFGGNFAPRGWAFCNGQLLSINENQALFSILGTTYGGDGRTTFGLPDLRGRVPMHAGSGPGLSPHALGEKGGAESVTLTEAQLPAHDHPAALRVSGEEANTKEPNKNLLAVSGQAPMYTDKDRKPQGQLGGNSLQVSPAGGGQAHTNLPPFQCVHYIIALQGIYPSRS